MQFSKIIGQENIKNQLIASVKHQRIAHAQLFFGPEGSGTLPLAIAYAQYISCTNKGENDSCGTCPSCHKYEKLIHPDLHFVYPVNTSKEVSKNPVSDDYIGRWREQLMQNPYFLSNQWFSYMGIENKQGLISKADSDSIIRKLNLKSFESDYKILVIWLPEKMNAPAANTLLKIIEEPPENTIFLLVTEEPQEVLLTISSRTQPVKLNRIDDESMQSALSVKYNLDNTQIANITRLANGNYMAAMEIIETSEENDFNFRQFTSIMRLCYSRNFIEINNWVEEMASIGREKIKSFFTYSLRLIRENFIMNLKNGELLYLTKEEEEFSRKFHPFINGRNILPINNEFNCANADIERNANAKIVLFDMGLNIVKLIRS